MNSTDLGIISNERKLQRILKLRNAFDKKQVVSVKSAANYFNYAESTVIKWAKEGDIPIAIDNKSTVVPMTDTNAPKWMRG